MYLAQPRRARRCTPGVALISIGAPAITGWRGAEIGHDSSRGTVVGIVEDVARRAHRADGTLSPSASASCALLRRAGVGLDHGDHVVGVRDHTSSSRSAGHDHVPPPRSSASSAQVLVGAADHHPAVAGREQPERAQQGMAVAFGPRDSPLRTTAGRPCARTGRASRRPSRRRRTGLRRCAARDGRPRGCPGQHQPRGRCRRPRGRPWWAHRRARR